MTAVPNIRRWKGTKVQTSEFVRRERQGTPRLWAWRKHGAQAARATRNGWSIFESAPKIDKFEPGAERNSRGASITPPRWKGKPGGASILVPEGEWSVEQQLREERDRER